jgi:hypothetical protein
VQLPAVERWLDEGWPPWRIAYGTVGLVATVAAVYGYVRQGHHPGAIWWLLAAVAVVAAWALGEMLRWRIKYRRLLVNQREASHQELSPAEEAATAAARRDAETARKLRKLFGDGRVLLTDIAASAGGDHASSREPIRYNMPGKIARWEENVIGALAEMPETRAGFERAPAHDGAVPSYGSARDRIRYQLTVIKTALNDSALEINATVPHKQPTRRARIRVITTDPFE